MLFRVRTSGKEASRSDVADSVLAWAAERRWVDGQENPRSPQSPGGWDPKRFLVLVRVRVFIFIFVLSSSSSSSSSLSSSSSSSVAARRLIPAVFDFEIAYGRENRRG